MSEQSPKSKWLAHLLDDLIKIPGTDRRIGLDPLIGLIPGMGDFLSSAAGLVVLASGARKKIPAGVYARMMSNWALNALVGAIPFVGDVFSFWFKSNRRNYLLMRAFVDEGEKGRASWWPVIILVIVAICVFGTIAAAGILLGKMLFGA